MFPIPDPPPSYITVPSLWVIPVHQYPAASPKQPVSCIKLGLAICFIYDIIYVSMSFSQIIPPSSSSTESKDYSVQLCVFCCLAYRVIVTIFLNSMYMHYCIIIPCIHMHTCICILYWCFTFWLTSLCIIGSSSIHFIRTDSNVLFLMAE